MVHHIKALNAAVGAGSTYAESTMSAAMGFHTDAQGDALGLLCLRQAPEGGESRWGTGDGAALSVKENGQQQHSNDGIAHGSTRRLQHVSQYAGISPFWPLSH
jgi:hypothetical protein